MSEKYEFRTVARIKVFGIGGAGCNAVNRMVTDGVKARAGRRFLGTNGATLWLWSCLPKPGSRGSPSLGMRPGALPFPRKELSPREALAVCTPPAPKPSARTPGS